MKLSLEDGRTVKFTHDAGGIIKSTQVDDAIKLRHWNTIVLQLERLRPSFFFSNPLLEHE